MTFGELGERKSLRLSPRRKDRQEKRKLAKRIKMLETQETQPFLATFAA